MSNNGFPWWMGYEGDQPMLDDIDAGIAECDRQIAEREQQRVRLDGLRAAMKILAAHTEWWLNSQDCEPMPHDVQTLEGAVKAADYAGEWLA